MPWTTPLTAVANTSLTAAQWNLSVRDNLLETAPAKATAANRIFVTTGANTIAERRIVDNLVDAAETTTSTTYTDLTTIGPQIASLVTGTAAFCFINAHLVNSVAGNGNWASLAITGASSIASADSRALYNQLNTFTRQCVSALIVVTAGNNTFTMEYRVTAGTGTFQRRRMQVMAL